MRRTIRKTFLLEGETVTMRHVKQLCGEERYRRMIGSPSAQDGGRSGLVAFCHFHPSKGKEQPGLSRTALKSVFDRIHHNTGEY